MIAGKTINSGNVGTTEATSLFTANQPTRLLGLTLLNIGEVDCWVKTFWQDTQDRYVEIPPNESVNMYENGETLGVGEHLSLQAETASAINYILRGEADS